MASDSRKLKKINVNKTDAILTDYLAFITDTLINQTLCIEMRKKFNWHTGKETGLDASGQIGSGGGA